MDAAELRELQRPLKERYRQDPSTARVPARAEAVVDVVGVAAKVTTETTSVVAGLHPAAGGTGALSCSADLLLQSLAACAAVTLASVATAMSVPIVNAQVVVEGHWDARGTLAVDREVPIGMTDITVTFDVQTDAESDTVSRLLDLTERYCVIAQTLAHPPVIEFRRAF